MNYKRNFQGLNIVQIIMNEETARFQRLLQLYEIELFANHQKSAHLFISGIALAAHVSSFS